MTDLAARIGKLSPEKRALLERRLSVKTAAPLSRISRRLPGTVAPLSFSQRRVWFLEQLSPGTATYNAPYAFRGTGKLDVSSLHSAVNAVVERHTVLRTRIEASPAGGAVTALATHWDAARIVDFRSCQAEGEQFALKAAVEEAQRPFNLSRDPMVRVTVFLFGEYEFLLLITAHHIAWDGISKEIFFRELGVLYENPGEAHKLSPLTIDYADFALWQESSFSGSTREAEADYWKRKLADAPPYLDIPLDKSRPAIQRFQGAKIPVVLGPNVLETCRRLSRAEGTTPYVAFLTAFKVFLAGLTSQADLCVCTPFAGRDQPETQQLIGFFTNTVVLRTQVEPGSSFRANIARVRETVLGAQEHQRMPMDQLVEILDRPRDLSRMPLAQVNFRLQGGKPPQLRLGELELRPLPLIDTCISKFDLALEIASAEGEAGYLEYNTDLFDASRMNRIPDAVTRLFGELMAEPDLPVRTLPGFSALEQLRPKRRRLAASPVPVVLRRQAGV